MSTARSHSRSRANQKRKARTAASRRQESELTTAALARELVVSGRASVGIIDSPHDLENFARETARAGRGRG